MTSPHKIRIFGDPVLKIKSHAVEQFDDGLKQLAADMLETMYEAPGVGLAASQIGVSKRLFVFDAGDGQGSFSVVNPVITRAEGEFTYDEGCLSVPGLQFLITRADQIEVAAQDLDGNEIHFAVSGYEAKILQHEIDHLDGKLLLERLGPEDRKAAMRSIRERQMKAGA